MDVGDPSPEATPGYVRTRIANACDICKARKVKCNGLTPCNYCQRRRQPHHCHYSPQRRRQPRPKAGQAGANVPTVNAASARASRASNVSSPVTGRQPFSTTTYGAQNIVPALGSNDSSASVEEHEEAEVPREARLLRDAQGKLIFIGDCAPLSFFQSVRQLVTTRVDGTAFAPQAGRFTILENPLPPASASLTAGFPLPSVGAAEIKASVDAYLSVTTGLVDIFENARLHQDVSQSIAGQRSQTISSDDMAMVAYCLVLAIGGQSTDAETAQVFFDHARDKAFASLGGNLSVATVQAFLLITLYMLNACQINGAFLFFGIAVRSAYSIGIHRAEVNSRFGREVRRQRDRLWKSLRVVDLFLSTSMGRPPATSDVDCTVSYREVGDDGEEVFDILNASVQIFLIIEGIVMEVYSRRKISLRLTEGISRELREWSLTWLQRLKDIIAKPSSVGDMGLLNGACQALSTYYYAVILVSRPFLMHEVHHRLSVGGIPNTTAGPGLTTGKSKVADACIDAAIMMIEPILDLIARGLVAKRSPVMVSWLFASSLVLGLGLLGSFGRIIEKSSRLSIDALEYFAANDTHAGQYALIASSLLGISLDFLERKERQERLLRTESSSQLFGLIPLPEGLERKAGSPEAQRRSVDSHNEPSIYDAGDASKDAQSKELLPSQLGEPSMRFSFDLDSSFLGLSDTIMQTPDLILNPSMGAGADSFAALNLFPLLDVGGHIDLTHHL